MCEKENKKYEKAYNQKCADCDLLRGVGVGQALRGVVWDEHVKE